jgi:hypothetical protein
MAEPARGRARRRLILPRAAAIEVDRQRDYDDWIEHVANGEERLTRDVDAWIVLAELTDLSLCTHTLRRSDGSKALAR